MNVGAEVQFCGKNAVAASMTGKERNLAAIQRTEDVSIGRLAKRRFQTYFFCLTEAGHGVEPAPPDNSDFRLRQKTS